MKKITIEEVKKAIWESEFTCDEDSVIYYLQVTDDGEVVNGSLKKLMSNLIIMLLTKDTSVNMMNTINTRIMMKIIEKKNMRRI